MYRWSACPGSVRLCRDIPSPTSVWAEEGSRVHAIAERFVKGDLPADEFWKLDEETRTCIQLYNDTLFHDFMPTSWPTQRTDDGGVLLIEHRFDLSSVYPNCFGTADAVMWKPKERLLRVYDYKHGKGVVVEVENNVQLLYYGLGALVTLKYPAKDVELVVVQPRAPHRKGPVRRWRVSAMHMMDFETELVEACERTEDPEAALNPGRHCFFCPAKNQCPAKLEDAQKNAADQFTDISTDDVSDIFS